MILKNNIGLGTSKYGKEVSHQELLEYAISIGYRLFDTAEIYTQGKSEILIGNAIRNSGIARKDFEIVTKFNPDNAVSKSDIRRKLEESMKRLNVDYVDVFMIHWWSSNINNTILNEVYTELLNERLIRFAGLSNFRLSDIVSYHKNNPNLSVVQYGYNITSRENETIRRYLLDNELTGMAYAPFRGGRINGNVKPPHPPESKLGDFWSDEKIRSLQKIANDIEVTIPQLILAFTKRDKNTITIPMSFNKQHLMDNLLSSNIVLSEDVNSKIDMIFPK